MRADQPNITLDLLAAHAVAADSASRFSARLRRALSTPNGSTSRRSAVVGQALTGRQRASRDAWKRKGLSAFDATMLAVQLGRRP